MTADPKRRNQEPTLDTSALLSLFSAMPDGIIVLDDGGVVRHANAAAHAIFAGRELLGTHLALPDAPPGSCREIDYIDSAGGSAWAELRAAGCTWSGRTATVVSLRDITERRALEQQLALAGRVFEGVREAIMVTDPDGVIVSVNRSFTTITGYSVDEALGHTPRLLKSGEHDPAFYALMWKSIVHNGFWNGEVISRRKDGSLFPELLSISSIQDGDGRVTHLVGIFSDLTQRKADEAALEEAHRQLLQSERVREELERSHAMANPPSLSVVSSMYSVVPLSRSAPGIFDELVSRYGETLLLALENLTLKVDNPVSDQLRDLADDMGHLRAGARDVAELHSRTLARTTKDLLPMKAKAMIEEGRFLVLELMGNLVSFYRRNYFRAPGALASADAANSKLSRGRSKKEST